MNIAALRSGLESDYAFLSKKSTLRYVFGLAPAHPTEREAYGIITPNHTLLFHSPFILPPQSSGFETVAMSPQHSLSWLVDTYLKPASQIAVEAEDLTVAEKDRLLALLGTNPEITFCDHYLKKMREIKTKQEIININKAVSITRKTLNWVNNFICENPPLGLTEVELQRLIDGYMAINGASGPAFPSIVAFDRNSALPHHVPGSARLKENSIVLIDIGANYKGYCGDMTRTWHLGSPTALFKKVETTVKKAYRAAYTLAASSPRRLVASDLDSAARTLITAAGFGDNFIHTTGHGIGLDAHEAPAISAHNDEVLQSGMAITIEPGIYLPGKFGYRFENTIIL